MYFFFLCSSQVVLLCSSMKASSLGFVFLQVLLKFFLLTFLCRCQFLLTKNSFLKSIRFSLLCIPDLDELALIIDFTSRSSRKITAHRHKQQFCRSLHVPSPTPITETSSYFVVCGTYTPYI